MLRVPFPKRNTDTNSSNCCNYVSILDEYCPNPDKAPVSLSACINEILTFLFQNMTPFVWSLCFWVVCIFCAWKTLFKLDSELFDYFKVAGLRGGSGLSILKDSCWSKARMMNYQGWGMRNLIRYQGWELSQPSWILAKSELNWPRTEPKSKAQSRGSEKPDTHYIQRELLPIFRKFFLHKPRGSPVKRLTCLASILGQTRRRDKKPTQHPFPPKPLYRTEAWVCGARETGSGASRDLVVNSHSRWGTEPGGIAEGHEKRDWPHLDTQGQRQAKLTSNQSHRGSTNAQQPWAGGRWENVIKNKISSRSRKSLYWGRRQKEQLCHWISIKLEWDTCHTAVCREMAKMERNLILSYNRQTQPITKLFSRLANGN